jgi:Rrf2 family protein
VKLSVKVDYSCRVLARMARMYGTDVLAHIEELARIEAVPSNYLVQILTELRNGGLIVSRRGKQGGYALARPPEEISLYDIVRVIEGDLLETNMAGEGQSGRRVAHVWGEVRREFEGVSRKWTLDKIASKAGEEMYYI